MALEKPRIPSNEGTAGLAGPFVLSCPLPSSASFSCSTLGTVAQAAGSSVVLSSAFNLARQGVLQKQGAFGRFECTAFSCDGLLIAAGQSGAEAKVIVWHSEGKFANTGEVTATEEVVFCLAFSNTGKYLAGICGSSGTRCIIVWDWRLGKEVAKQRLQSETRCLAWADTTTVVTAGAGLLKAWTLTKAQGFAARQQPSLSGNLVLTPRPTNLRSLGGADFVSIASGGQDGSSGMYALTTGGVVGLMRGASRDFDKLVDLKAGQAFAIAISRSYVAVGCSGGRVLILTANTLNRKLILELPVEAQMPAAEVHCTACGFGRRGETLVAAYSCGKIISWDLRSGEQGQVKAAIRTQSARLVGMQPLPAKAVLPRRSLALNASEQDVALSIDQQCQILAIDLPAPGSIQGAKNSPSVVHSGLSLAVAEAGLQISCFAASSSGDYFAAGTSSGTILVELRGEGGELRIDHVSHTSAVSALIFGSSPEYLLASADIEGRVAIHRPANLGQLPSKARLVHTGGAVGLSFVKSDILMSASAGEIHFLEVTTGRRVLRKQTGIGALAGVSTSRDGSLLAVLWEDCRIETWQCADQSILCSFTTPASSAKIVCGAIHPQGSCIAVAHADLTVRVYEISTGTCIATAPGAASPMISLQFLGPSGLLLVAATTDGCVSAWKLESDLICPQQLTQAATAQAPSAAFAAALQARDVSSLSLATAIEHEMDSKTSPDKKQGKENSPNKLPKRCSPLRRSLAFQHVHKKSPIRVSKDGFRAARARQRSEPLLRKGTDPWEILKPKSAATIKKVRPIHTETPKPAKERKFLKQDLAVINEQFEALGKDWSKMKNMQPQRGQQCKASRPMSGSRRAQSRKSLPVLKSLAKWLPSDEASIASNEEGPAPEELQEGMERSPSVDCQLPWTARTECMQTANEFLPPTSCTPEDISRLAIRLSFSAAASSSGRSRGSDDSFIRQRRALQDRSTPASMISIDAAGGIRAAGPSRGHSGRNRTSVTPLSLWGGKPAPSASVTPSFDKFNPPQAAADYASNRRASQRRSTTTGAAESDLRGNRSLNAVSKGSVGLRADTQRENASPSVGPHAEVQSKFLGTGPPPTRSFSFDVPAAVHRRDASLWQSHAAHDQDSVPSALSVRGTENRRPEAEATCRRRGSVPNIGNGTQSTAQNFARHQIASSSSSNEKFSGPSLGLTPFLSALEVPHGIEFSPDSVVEDEREAAAKDESKKGPDNVQWNNPFFDRSISPKKPAVVADLELNNVQFDYNPAYESSRGGSTERRRDSLARLMQQQRAGDQRGALTRPSAGVQASAKRDFGEVVRTVLQRASGPAQDVEKIEQLLGIQVPQTASETEHTLSRAEAGGQEAEGDWCSKNVAEGSRVCSTKDVREEPIGGLVPAEQATTATPGPPKTPVELCGKDGNEMFFSPELLPVSGLQEPFSASKSKAADQGLAAGDRLFSSSSEDEIPIGREEPRVEEDSTPTRSSKELTSEGGSTGKRKKTPVHKLWSSMKFWKQRQPELSPSPVPASARAARQTRTAGDPFGTATPRLQRGLEALTDTDTDDILASNLSLRRQELSRQSSSRKGEAGLRPSNTALPRSEEDYLQALQSLRSSANGFQELLRELSLASQSEENKRRAAARALAAKLHRRYTEEVVHVNRNIELLLDETT